MSHIILGLVVIFLSIFGFLGPGLHLLLNNRGQLTSRDQAVIIVAFMAAFSGSIYGIYLVFQSVGSIQ